MHNSELFCSLRVTAGATHNPLFLTAKLCRGRVSRPTEVNSINGGSKPSPYLKSYC